MAPEVSFNWEWLITNFGTRTQTKNESAAEVAELVTIEIKKLSEGKIPETEFNPRRLVLTGGFGQNLKLIKVWRMRSAIYIPLNFQQKI